MAMARAVKTKITRAMKKARVTRARATRAMTEASRGRRETMDTIIN
jgi:hypothetical protein